MSNQEYFYDIGSYLSNSILCFKIWQEMCLRWILLSFKNLRMALLIWIFEIGDIFSNLLGHLDTVFISEIFPEGIRRNLRVWSYNWKKSCVKKIIVTLLMTLLPWLERPHWLVYIPDYNTIYKISIIVVYHDLEI